MRRIVFASIAAAFVAVVMIGLVSPPATVAQAAAIMHGEYDGPRTRLETRAAPNIEPKDVTERWAIRPISTAARYHPHR